jgi:hypothetical protein
MTFRVNIEKGSQRGDRLLAEPRAPNPRAPFLARAPAGPGKNFVEVGAPLSPGLYTSRRAIKRCG